MWFLSSVRMLKKCVHRIVYAYACIMLLLTVGTFTIGHDHFKYHLDLGNMSETQQLGATPEQLAAMHKAEKDDEERINKTRAPISFRPAEKPSVPKVKS